MRKTVKELADWAEMPKHPGLYLSLTHGRDFPQQAVKHRGFVGPKIGPLLYMKTHNSQQIILRFANVRDPNRFFPKALFSTTELEVIEGTLVYGEKCFGHWDLCCIAREFCKTENLSPDSAGSPVSPS